jgi:hypothetical protein
MTKKLLATVIFLFVLIIGFVYLVISRPRAGLQIPDTQDSQEIQEVIYHSYTIFQEALQNGGDVSEFKNVLTNSPEYSYENSKGRSLVILVLGKEEADNAGYRTVMEAKYIAYGCGVRLFKETEKVAKEENREVTADELKSIQDHCYGVLPPSQSGSAPLKLDFQNIDIEGDRAVVRYDDGAALLEAILVRENGRWLIGNIKPIEIHF